MKVVQFSAPFPKISQVNGSTMVEAILPKPLFGERLVQIGVEYPHSAPFMASTDGIRNQIIVAFNLANSKIPTTVSEKAYYISPRDILEFDDLAFDDTYQIHIKIPEHISKYCIVTAAYDKLENLQKEGQ